MAEKTRNTGLWRLWCSLAAVLSVCTSVLYAAETDAQQAEKALAREILDAAGIQGGLIVHIGCGDAKLTAAMRATDRYLVQGLDADAKDMEKARRYIRSLGVYGKVAVDQLRDNRLPYVENLVNLVVSEDIGNISMEEVIRVLCPNGVAYIKADGKWTKTVKPRPEEIDEWTHFLHGPDNNAVAHDSVVDLPRRLQWLGLPKFARAHEQAASLSACVTAGGRLFYIIDDTPRADIRFPAEWSLVARDAFSGVPLWKRPIPAWINQLRRFRSGPAETAFRLAAKNDRVYATLGIDAPVSILDAATGKTLATCAGTKDARQILCIGDVLVVLVDTRPQANEGKDSAIRRGREPASGKRAIVAADPATGKTIWRKEIEAFVHPTLAARGGRLFYQTNADVYCLDLGDGKQVWSVPAKMELAGHEAGWESPTLVAGDGVVYCADFKKLIAFSAKDGKVLWQGPSRAGYNSPPEVFLIGGLVWTKGKGMTGADPNTGAVKKEVPTIGGYMHHRCYRNKATDRFILRGDQGVQFVDLESGNARIHHWIRGTCQYGIMPANGLLYVTPDSCACNLKTKLNGFWTLAPDAGQKSKGPKGERLEKGPALGKIDAKTPPGADSNAWPVYRHDFARSGMTKASGPDELKPAWTADIGGRLSGVTVAGGKVFVAAVDKNTVYALGENSGKTVWTFTAGGRIDSPPTIYKGMALFGSADGYVYALRAADGELAWRFRAAPEDRRTFVNGQIESVWPVHGSVIVHDGKLTVAAGRSSYLDGGIHVYRLDPGTGKMLSETVMYSPDPKTGKQPTGGDRKDVRGALSDILVSDGEDVYMRHVKLDFKTGNETGKGVHLFCPIGLLDDTWWHRAYWLVNDHFISHWSGWWKVGNQVPSGRILSYDDVSIFGYGRDKYPGGNTGQWRGGEKYQLFAADRASPGQQAKQEPKPVEKPVAGKKSGKRARRPKQPPPPPQKYRWTTQIPFYVRAMVVAGEKMFLAGPSEMTETKGGGGSLDLVNPADALAAWEGKKGVMLWAVSTKDGKKLAETKLDSLPVWDGMAAIDGRLYLATQDGKVVCFGGR